MKVERDATNKLLIDGRQTLTAPRFLLHFTSTQTGANVYAITQNSGAVSGPLILTFDEVGDGGTVAPTSGDILLSPAGWWELSVYEQTSTTNLDPANASRLVASMGVEVVGTSCTASAYTENQCPGGGGEGCGETLTIRVYVDGVLASTTTGLDACENQTVNIG